MRSSITKSIANDHLSEGHGSRNGSGYRRDQAGPDLAVLDQADRFIARLEAGLRPPVLDPGPPRAAP